MKVVPSRIEGCFLVEADCHRDERGELVKFFQQTQFAAAGLHASFPEDFHSTSRKGVLRGLHFQRPPHEQFKLVHCMRGRIFDVILDLRRQSPTFGAYQTFELSGETPSGVYLCPGVAHGFYVLSDEAVLTYKVSREHSPEHDVGVFWQAAGIPWPDPNPLISPRDAALPRWSEFETPFR